MKHTIIERMRSEGGQESLEKQGGVPTLLFGSMSKHVCNGARGRRGSLTKIELICCYDLI